MQRERDRLGERDTELLLTLDAAFFTLRTSISFEDLGDRLLELQQEQLNLLVFYSPSVKEINKIHTEGANRRALGI